MVNDRTVEQEYIPRMSKVFSVYVVLLPILQYYKSPLSSFNLATFLTIILFPILLFSQHGNIKWYANLLPINVYTLFITFNVVLTTILYKYPISMEYDGAYLRMLLLFVSILYLGQFYFNVEYATRALEILLIVSAAFMVIQFVSSFVLGYYITGKINALVTLEDYTSISRVTGFYMEPAQYSQSATLYLSLRLFSADEKSNVRKILIVILGVVMSGSGQGYFFLVMIGAFYLLEYNKHLNSRKLLYGMMFFCVFVILAIIVTKIPYVKTAISRIIPSETGVLGGAALAGRTYTNKYYMLLSPIQKRWGVGFGLVQTAIPSSKFAYVNTLYVHLIECGYVSIAIWIMMLLYCFIKSAREIRVFLILYTIMLYFSGMGRPMMICYFFSFILAQMRNSKMEDKEVPGKAILSND